jgi:hypothetical protein
MRLSQAPTPVTECRATAAPATDGKPSHRRTFRDLPGPPPQPSPGSMMAVPNCGGPVRTATTHPQHRGRRRPICPSLRKPEPPTADRKSCTTGSGNTRTGPPTGIGGYLRPGLSTSRVRGRAQEDPDRSACVASSVEARLDGHGPVLEADERSHEPCYWRGVRTLERTLPPSYSPEGGGVNLARPAQSDMPAIRICFTRSLVSAKARSLKHSHSVRSLLSMIHKTMPDI